MSRFTTFIDDIPTLCFVCQWKFPRMWGEDLSLTTQSGSSGTTSQNDRACRVRGVGRGVTAAARASFSPRAPSPFRRRSPRGVHARDFSPAKYARIIPLGLSRVSLLTSQDRNRRRRERRRRWPGSVEARRRRPATGAAAQERQVGILCPGGPCGWAVTGAIFGSSAILHQSRPIQAGPAVEDRYSASAARDPVTRPVDPVVHCGGHA